MLDFFKTILYEPLFNGFIFLTSIVPGADVGLSIILLTVFIRLLLFPLQHKSTKSQAKMKTLDPELKKIKEKYEKDKQEQARQTMEFYKKHGINPFSGCLVLIIQLPIIITLYFVFWKGLSFDKEMIAMFAQLPGHINTNLLDKSIIYSFVETPEFLKVKFLGLFDMVGKSYYIALAAGVSQYFQMKLAMPNVGKFSLKSTGSFKDDLTRNMGFQFRYILPVFVFFIAYTISSAVALYWTTSNIFSIVHEFAVKRKLKQTQENSLSEDNTEQEVKKEEKNNS